MRTAAIDSIWWCKYVEQAKVVVQGSTLLSNRLSWNMTFNWAVIGKSIWWWCWLQLSLLINCPFGNGGGGFTKVALKQTWNCLLTTDGAECVGLDYFVTTFFLRLLHLPPHSTKTCKGTNFVMNCSTQAIHGCYLWCYKTALSSSFVVDIISMGDNETAFN